MLRKSGLLLLGIIIVIVTALVLNQTNDVHALLNSTHTVTPVVPTKALPTSTAPLVTSSVIGTSSAVIACNDAAGLDATIERANSVDTYDVYLQACVYRFTHSYLLRSSIVFYGRGVGESVIEGTGKTGLFSIASTNGTVQFRNVTFRAGRGGTGIGTGAIRLESGTLQIFDSSFEDFTVTRKDVGGAITAKDTIYLRRVMFKNNSALEGGAVNTSAPFDIECARFVGNRATLAGGGIIYAGLSADARVTNSTFINNVAPIAGRMIYNDGSSIINAAGNYWFDGLAQRTAGTPRPGEPNPGDVNKGVITGESLTSDPTGMYEWVNGGVDIANQLSDDPTAMYETADPYNGGTCAMQKATTLPSLPTTTPTS